jgi:hypothetical protein
LVRQRVFGIALGYEHLNMHRRCCGLDVHKETVVACLRLVSDGQVTTEVRTLQTTTADLLRLSKWLAERVHACGDGGDRRPLEAGVAYLG